MPELHKCWTCGTSLLSGTPAPDDCFFWCCTEHKEEYNNRTRLRRDNTVINHTKTIDEKTTTAPSQRVTSARLRRLNDAARVAPIKKQRMYTCGVCGEKGHNARSCKQR